MRMLAVLAATTIALATNVPIARGQENNSETTDAERTGESQPTRETEIMLRKHIDAMRIGKPIYQMMTPELVAAVKPYEEIGKKRFAQLGAIRSIEFRGTTSSGVDTYYVQYENGASDYFIALTTEGKIGALVVRSRQ
jgi:hypothetical protein